ncbi:MAG: hypothetical protein ACK5XN_23525 [Bacteroidota bacterium]
MACAHASQADGTPLSLSRASSRGLGRGGPGQNLGHRSVSAVRSRVRAVVRRWPTPFLAPPQPRPLWRICAGDGFGGWLSPDVAVAGGQVVEAATCDRLWRAPSAPPTDRATTACRASTVAS